MQEHADLLGGTIDGFTDLCVGQLGEVAKCEHCAGDSDVCRKTGWTKVTLVLPTKAPAEDA